MIDRHTLFTVSTNPKCRFLLRPGKGAVYCDQFVCLSVYLSVTVREHISGTAGPIFTFRKSPVCGRGSVLLWRRCDTLCTSGFMDDVAFGRSGSYGDAWTGDLLPLAALRYRGV